MTGGILGGGILLAVLALLWIAVLVPTWVSNREQRAAEQYAVRLQRTIRLLAETAEVPEEHVVEANAKQVLAHEKLLKASREHEEAQMKTQLKTQQAQQRREAYVEQQKLRAARAQARKARLMAPKFRFVRLTAAALAVVGVLGTLIGIGLALGGVGVALMWLSLTALVLSSATLVVLAPGRVRHPVEVPAPLQDSIPESAATDQTKEAPTPERDHAAEAAAYRAAQERAAQARERARAMVKARETQAPQASRTNQTDSILLRETPAPAPRTEATPQLDVAEKSRQLAAKQRLQKMGVVGDTTKGATSLEEALRRRRNAS